MAIYTKKSEKKVAFIIRLPKVDADRLRKMARVRGVSVNQLVKDLINI
jgi:predicted HicB family RNase H-like nuclease